MILYKFKQMSLSNRCCLISSIGNREIKNGCLGQTWLPSFLLHDRRVSEIEKHVAPQPVFLTSWRGKKLMCTLKIKIPVPAYCITKNWHMSVESHLFDIFTWHSFVKCDLHDSRSDACLENQQFNNLQNTKNHFRGWAGLMKL